MQKVTDFGRPVEVLGCPVKLPWSAVPTPPQDEVFSKLPCSLEGYIDRSLPLRQNCAYDMVIRAA